MYSSYKGESFPIFFLLIIFFDGIRNEDLSNGISLINELEAESTVRSTDTTGSPLVIISSSKFKPFWSLNDFL